MVDAGGGAVTLPHTVLEGHRFVARPVAAGEPLLSWSTPFATALRDLGVGDYVCTPSSLAAVTARGVEGLPPEASAQNVPLDPYRLDETAVRLGEQVSPVERPGTFLGYRRERGPAGTRNHVVLVATSSRSSAFVTELARRFGADSGVVPVAHTEGGEAGRPNNLHFLLATLSRLPAELERRRCAGGRHRGRRRHRPAPPGLHGRAAAIRRSRCRTPSSPGGAASRRTCPQPPGSWRSGCRRSRPSGGRRCRSRTSGSACSAAAPTPSPASLPTRCPAPSAVR